MPNFLRYILSVPVKKGIGVDIAEKENTSTFLFHANKPTPISCLSTVIYQHSKNIFMYSQHQVINRSSIRKPVQVNILTNTMQVATFRILPNIVLAVTRDTRS